MDHLYYEFCQEFNDFLRSWKGRLSSQEFATYCYIEVVNFVAENVPSKEEAFHYQEIMNMYMDEKFSDLPCKL